MLVIRINDKIRRNLFVATRKHNADAIFEQKQSAADFSKEAESAYQSVRDLISRFNKIDAAIVRSNVETMIETVCGGVSVVGGHLLKKPDERLRQLRRRGRLRRKPAGQAER